MPETPSDLIRRYYQLVDADRIDEMLALFDPRATYIRGGTPPMRGIAALNDFYRGGRIIAHGRHELFAVVADGAWVAVRGRFTGTLKSGEAVQVDFADFHRIDNTLITERFTYFLDRSI